MRKFKLVVVFNINFFILLIFFLFSNISNSQTIRGKIVNIIGENIPYANIIIKDSINSKNIKEFTIARNGLYSIKLKKNYKNIYIEIVSNGYQLEKNVINNPIINKTYIQNFELIKDKTIELNEVLLISEKKTFIIKEDTVKYNIWAYKDGSERKIQDIIKKLPGIEVNEKSGEIKYKGKSIETVKLEDDDLFGHNYSIGTKNINVDMVEQVQVIENYSENPLLKGIENGDKVALNLKLKKGKFDFSGNVDFGNGLFEENKIASNNGFNILGISSKFKSFGTLSFNNIGQNNSPYDYFSNQQSIEHIKENNFYAKKIISENLFFSNLDDNRSNLNNQFFGNYNYIIKLGKRTSLKTNFYYLKDKIVSMQNTTSINDANTEIINTSDDLNIEKKPNLYRADTELKIKTSENSLLEYRFNIFQENIETPTNGRKNNTLNFYSDIQTRNFFLKNNLLFTQKLTNNKVIQLSINHSINNTPQQFLITPSISNNITSQISEFKKKYLQYYISLLGNTKNTKYNIKIGGLINSNLFNSLLSNFISDNIDNTYKNNLTFNQKSFFLLSSTNILYGNLKISPTLKIKLLYQDLKNNFERVIFQQENLIFEPNLTLKYKLNENSFISSTINYNINPLTEDYSYTNPVLINNRILQSNTPSLELQKSLNISTLFINNNLFKQFQLNIGVNYNQNKGTYFSNIEIQNNNTFMNNFYLNEINNNLNLYFLIQKYIPNVKSTIRIKSNYIVSNYKNIINNSELRNNKNGVLSTEVFIKTAFNTIINFENIIKYNQNISKSNNIQNFQNTSINNTFKTIIKPTKKWFILLSSDYFIPNTNKNESYLFLDASLKYKPKNKIFDLSLEAKNILNKNTFTQIQTNDFSESKFINNLLSRYIMLNISYNF